MVVQFAGVFVERGHNPVGVASLFATAPKVAPSSQPWAGGLNPFGILCYSSKGGRSVRRNGIAAYLLLVRRTSSGAAARFPIPKGLSLPAKGCEARATLGTLVGKTQPQRGCALPCIRTSSRPCRNPFRPFTFTSFSLPKIAALGCVINLFGLLCTGTSARFRNNSIVPLF